MRIKFRSVICWDKEVAAAKQVEATDAEEQGMSTTEFDCTDPECGCKTPTFTEAYEALRFLSGRFKHAGVAHEVAQSYARDIDAILARQSTPAVEVTADAVTANALAAYTLAWDAKKNPFECMQAALAAALPALTQQVERLTKQNRILEIKNSGTLANNLCPNCRDKQVGKPCLACTIDTLSAENARLAKDAERYRWLRDASANQYTKPIVVAQSLVDGRMFYMGPMLGAPLDNAIDAAIKDAATAQAKPPTFTNQGYDDTGSAPHD